MDMGVPLATTQAQLTEHQRIFMLEVLKMRSNQSGAPAAEPNNVALLRARAAARRK